jgi:hypothetical protein
MKMLRFFLMVVILISISMLAIAPGALGSELSDEDRKIIDTAAEKAKEMGAELLPICQDTEDGFFIPAGYAFAMYKGNFAFKEGQLVVNAGYSPLFFGEVVLLRGEYALVLYNGVVKKGAVPIDGPKGRADLPNVKSGYSGAVQRIFFGNY